MSGTPEPDPQSDPPPASTVAEENKPVPTHHSPAPWSLHPRGDQEGDFPEHAFEIRDRDGNVVAYIAYNPDKGIGPLELADAALILASPRLLSALDRLFHGFLFLAGNVAFEPNSSAAEEVRRLKVETGELLTDLRKAGVL